MSVRPPDSLPGSSDTAPSGSPVGSATPSRQALLAARNRAIMRQGATWFFYIAGLSLINSVLFWAGSTWAFVVGLGITDLANSVGHDVITGSTGMVSAIVFDVIIAGAFAGIGYLARKGIAWAFIVGMVVYVLDALLLLWATDWLSVIFHAVALFYIARGFQARRALAAVAGPPTSTPGIAPPIVPR